MSWNFYDNYQTTTSATTDNYQTTFATTNLTYPGDKWCEVYNLYTNCDEDCKDCAKLGLHKARQDRDEEDIP